MMGLVYDEPRRVDAISKIGSRARELPRAQIPQNQQERTQRMAYVIAEPCIGTKDNSCVEVCPVDCIHPTPDEPGYEAAEMLYIDPEECIDCDACVEACPVDACFAEDQLPDEWQKYSQINADYFANAK
jgi:ferredoxin